MLFSKQFGAGELYSHALPLINLVQISCNPAGVVRGEGRKPILMRYPGRSQVNGTRVEEASQKNCLFPQIIVAEKKPAAGRTEEEESNTQEKLHNIRHT